MERVPGAAPRSSVWKTDALLLSYTRIELLTYRGFDRSRSGMTTFAEWQLSIRPQTHEDPYYAEIYWIEQSGITLGQFSRLLPHPAAILPYLTHPNDNIS